MVSKRKRLFTWIFVGSVVLLGIALVLFFIFNIAPARYYERNWKISLPNGIQQVYDIKSPTEPNGDGYHFTAFRIKDKNMPLLSDTKEQIENLIESEITSILDELKADKNQYPDFSHPYLWKTLTAVYGTETLYIIYDTKSSLLYFTQIFR